MISRMAVGKLITLCFLHALMTPALLQMRRALDVFIHLAIPDTASTVLR